MKYKPKKTESRQKNYEKKTATNLTARGKMIFLLLWSLFCIVLYLTLLQFYALTPVVVMELLLLLGVVLLFVSIIAVKLEKAKSTESSERLIKLEDRIRLLKIFILPPTIIVLVDFLISIYRFSSLGM